MFIQIHYIKLSFYNYNMNRIVSAHALVIKDLCKLFVIPSKFIDEEFIVSEMFPSA